MLEWKAFHRIVDIGRLHARERLDETRDRLLEHRWFSVAEE
jgi:hypothetical protein